MVPLKHESCADTTQGWDHEYSRIQLQRIQFQRVLSVLSTRQSKASMVGMHHRYHHLGCEACKVSVEILVHLQDQPHWRSTMEWQPQYHDKITIIWCLTGTVCSGLTQTMSLFVCSQRQVWLQKAPWSFGNKHPRQSGPGTPHVGTKLKEMQPAA